MAFGRNPILEKHKSNRLNGNLERIEIFRNEEDFVSFRSYENGWEEDGMTYSCVSCIQYEMERQGKKEQPKEGMEHWRKKDMERQNEKNPEKSRKDFKTG